MLPGATPAIAQLKVLCLFFFRYRDGGKWLAGKASELYSVNARLKCFSCFFLYICSWKITLYEPWRSSLGWKHSFLDVLIEIMPNGVRIFLIWWTASSVQLYHWTWLLSSTFWHLFTPTPNTWTSSDVTFRPCGWIEEMGFSEEVSRRVLNECAWDVNKASGWSVWS